MTMVYFYNEVGRMIVEEEQHGKERAEYGKYILHTLSSRLTEEFAKGFSLDNLKLMRRFTKFFQRIQLGKQHFPNLITCQKR